MEKNIHRKSSKIATNKKGEKKQECQRWYKTNERHRERKADTDKKDIQTERHLNRKK